MSNITKEALTHIADLARLNISEAEAVEFSQQLTKVMAYFTEISKVDTTGIDPLITPTDMKIYWREDKMQSEYSVEEIVANAPEKTGNLFTVPPVV